MKSNNDHCWMSVNHGSAKLGGLVSVNILNDCLVGPNNFFFLFGKLNPFLFKFFSDDDQVGTSLWGSHLDGNHKIKVLSNNIGLAI